jgi:hypothetical protein
MADPQVESAVTARGHTRPSASYPERFGRRFEGGVLRDIDVAGMQSRAGDFMRREVFARAPRQPHAGCWMCLGQDARDKKPSAMMHTAMMAMATKYPLAAPRPAL